MAHAEYFSQGLKKDSSLEWRKWLLKKKKDCYTDLEPYVYNDAHVELWCMQASLFTLVDGSALGMHPFALGGSCASNDPMSAIFSYMRPTIPLGFIPEISSVFPQI